MLPLNLRKIAEVGAEEEIKAQMKEETVGVVVLDIKGVTVGWAGLERGIPLKSLPMMV